MVFEILEITIDEDDVLLLSQIATKVFGNNATKIILLWLKYMFKKYVGS
jgi:hypothetical protein